MIRGMMHKLNLLIIILTILLMPAIVKSECKQGYIDWINQFGTSGNDITNSLSVYSGNIYAAGSTTGSFTGQNYGNNDVFIKAFSYSGNQLWTSQFGSQSNDYGNSITADSNGIYISGTTQGSIFSQSLGSSDSFIAKYSDNGNIIWSVQYGASGADYGRGIFSYGSNLYVTGTAGKQVYARSYDANGNLRWNNFFNIRGSDVARGIFADMNGVYVVGDTGGIINPSIKKYYPDYGDLPLVEGYNVFVRKYNLNGALLWTKEFGTELFDFGFAIAADDEGIYVTGNVPLALASQSYGRLDGFIKKISHDGDDIWTRQFGTQNDDYAQSVFINGTKIYVAGYSGNDAFVYAYDRDGNFIWKMELGSSGKNRANGVYGDINNLYITGYTSSNLPNQTSFGSNDAFLAKLKIEKCPDNDNDNYGYPYEDCNDNDASVYNNAEELCDSKDNDCDGMIGDDGFSEPWFNQTTICGIGECIRNGYYTCSAGSQLNVCIPGAPQIEICDSLDNDCNGIVDNGFDNDGDNYAICTGDCDDNNAAIYPGAAEICDILDNDCDGVRDEYTCAGQCVDYDNDKYGVNNDPSCQFPDYDCNDENKKANPGQTESCSTIFDDNCDGIANNGCDNDNDGYLAPDECNDFDPSVNPGAAEICNSKDDNCNGQIDEIGGCVDSDNDNIVDNIDICPSDPNNECNANKTQEYITSTTTAVLSTQNNETTLQIGSGDLAYDSVITVEKNPAFGPNFALSTGTTPAKSIYSYTFSPGGQQFADNIVMTMYWQDADNNGREDTTNQNENKINIYWYNIATGNWEAQIASCDLVNNFCSLSINHFSDYALAAIADADEDGYIEDDCDDNDPEINPSAVEIPGNDVDENCDLIILCDSSAQWKNHGNFVSCVAKEAEKLLKQGLITKEEKDAIVNAAAKSDLGKNKIK